MKDSDSLRLCTIYTLYYTCYIEKKKTSIFIASFSLSLSSLSQQ